MEQPNCLYLEPYQDYLNHIEQCKTKIYDKSIVLHDHHIVPRSHGGSNAKTNLVCLSVEDHITAHLLFAKCFDVGTSDYIHNLRSARLLRKKSVVYSEDLQKLISETYTGDKNPFFGKSHSTESKKAISEAVRNARSGVGYSDLYSDPEMEKEKRRKGVTNSWSEMSDCEKSIRSQNIKNSLLKTSKEDRVRRASHAALKHKPWIIIENTKYLRWSEAEHHYGMTRFKIERRHNVTYERKTE